jgi:hypothetical protein
MIHVQFDPSQLTGDLKAFWDDWLPGAVQATRDAIGAWENLNHQLPLIFKDDIWKKLRTTLLKKFFPDKCAYCEAPLTRDYGASEHYRPKGAVTPEKEGGEQTAGTATEDETGQNRPHPGYFWLAYHWKNLVPSCDRCNSGTGKQNQFPVKKQYRMVKHLSTAEVAALGDTPFLSPKHPGVVYLEPDELDRLEQPLLLHPFGSGEYDPRHHICFGDGGIEAPREINGAPSLRGEATIRVCQLYNDELRRARGLAQINAMMQYCTAWAAQAGQPGGLSEAKDRVWQTPLLAQLKAGCLPYSAAALDCIDLLRKTMGQSG